MGNPGFPQGFDPSFLGEIVEQKLQPLGVIARRDQDEAELRRAEPLLALTFRAAVIPFRVVNGLARFAAAEPSPEPTTSPTTDTTYTTIDVTTTTGFTTTSGREPGYTATASSTRSGMSKFA